MTSDDRSPAEIGIVQIGDVEFDARAGELRRGDITTRLEPQPARVLALLVDRRGEVVTRGELQQHVWSGDTFVDFERGLNYCIARIRTALGDSASEPRFIETLPRRGYRLIAPVRGRETGNPTAREDIRATNGPESQRQRTETPRPQPADSAPPADRSWSSRGRWKTWRAAVALAFAGVATWAVVAGRPTLAPTMGSPSDTRVRIAVVRFDNETGVPDYDRLAQSLTDATVARLAADPTRVAVIGNAPILQSSRSFRDVAVIGRTLDVGHVILGQIQQVGGQLRITTHLIRVDDQSHVWARRFEPGPADAATLDQTVSEAVAGAVAKRLLGG